MQTKKIVPRQDAINKGAFIYFTGKPCKNGHTASRYTLNGACIECLRASRDSKRKMIKESRAKVVS